MDKQKDKLVRRTRRRIGIRKRVQGTPERPRMSIYRSLNHIYVQVIDDLAGATVASASTRDKAFGAKGGTGNAAAAAEVGKLIAERARQAGVSSVVFDRGGFKYHGRVKALADAAREGGLQF
ncbi:MAG: 50S ribosomal protein L18 [Phycisphaerales bacterium JB040]